MLRGNGPSRGLQAPGMEAWLAPSRFINRNIIVKIKKAKK
jgi:hypothetical protein